MQKPLALEREVQEHRRTEAARDHHAERERLFSAAVESSNDAIITMSLDGTITGWNSAAERLFGYTAAEAVGENITLLVPDDRLPEIQDTLRRIGWGESIEHNETVRLRKDGSRIEVSLSISPIKSPSGATIGISKVARDITDANKTRQVLRQQTEELRRIFETSQDLIMVMDSRGFLVQISPSCEAILGYRPEEMIGRSGADFIHPDHLENSRAGNARGAARATSEDRRYALHPQGRTGGVAVLARHMVRAGQAVLLRRPRHDRKPAGAGNAARKRTAGARHHRHRARRLRPDRRAGHHPGLEFAGRKFLRLAARRSARQERVRTDGPAGRARAAQDGAAILPAYRRPCGSPAAAAKSRSGGGTERRSTPN